MRKRTLFGIDSVVIDPSDSVALDVAFYSPSLNDIVIRDSKNWVDGETPIGIVVVPGTHNRYGDGTCGIMSLVEMSLSTPETGQTLTSSNPPQYYDSSQNAFFGYYDAAVRNNIFTSNYPSDSTSRVYIPYQASKNSSTTAILGNSGTNFIWPYSGTETTPIYEPSTSGNITIPDMTATNGHAMADFNGIKNTAALYVATIDSAQWTDATIWNNYTTGTTGYTPAAACAGRFKTVGTKSFYEVYNGITQNDITNGTAEDTHDYRKMWYLPALGELCYIPPLRWYINNTINELTQKYGKIGIQLTFTDNEFNGIGKYQSSTSCLNAKTAWGMYFAKSPGSTGGEAVAWNRTDAYSNRVRAFMRL